MKNSTLLLLLMAFPVFAQEDYSPFNPISNENTYGIKAKALPFFLGNGFGFYSSLGTEIGFLKNQSFTAEWFFNYGQGSHDEVIDRYGNEFESGNRSHMNEHALQLGYRYYYGFQKIRQRSRLAFYNGLFFRSEKGRTMFFLRPGKRKTSSTLI
ncbi:MAG: hypothetical protein QM710_02940 [Flavobacterium sp.]